ncbi:hypothetical protein ON010_g13107 [Phytophthora cinnamomi]|nr:hypothetical protein ON010_g13107 [Phytophthora cinnamomi]
MSTPLAVVSSENGDYLQIGDNNGQDIFVLSVFIQAALNLSKVVEAAIEEDREALERTGFWLSYSLFDVVVQTDVFYNLSVAEFSPIRDSFRVRSRLKELARCIGDLACLTVFMCTENRVLAGVEIPLTPLLSRELFSRSDNELDPGDTSEIEGTFSFPDFDEAVVTASITMEFVESTKSKYDRCTFQRKSEIYKRPDDDTSTTPVLEQENTVQEASTMFSTVEASPEKGLQVESTKLHLLEKENTVQAASTIFSTVEAPPEKGLQVESTKPTSDASQRDAGIDNLPGDETPIAPVLGKENTEASTIFSTVEAAPKKGLQDKSSSCIERETEETKLHTPSARQTSMTEVSADNSHPHTDEEIFNRAREQQKEVAQLKETLEQARSAWKQEQYLQQLQWKRRFAEMEKARMDELEEEWARREEERSNLLKSAQDEYHRLEQTLRKSLADLETRERRLAVAEAALKREQEAKRDENEFLQRRLKTEHSHTLSVAKKQTEAYERRISMLETQLSDAERRAKQVETDFNEYRQQQRKLPESRLREEIAALKGTVGELEKHKMVKERECEVAEANVQNMKGQLEHMASLLAQEKKKHEARVVDELEKLRVKYIAREEKYVLDGDRDELRAIKRQLDDLKGFNLRGDSRKRRSRKHRSPSPHYRHGQQWHTQSRHTTATNHTPLAGQPYVYQHQASSSFSDRASNGGSGGEDHSYIETNRAATDPLDVFHQVQSQTSDHEGESMRGGSTESGSNLGASIHSYGEPPDTELGRLLRERKLLLASGAYDEQSYLVRELDRLINVTRANAEHQGSIAQKR